MARTTSLNLQSPDITAIDLNRILSRLEHKILSSPDPRLRYSSYERTKTSANLEYARTLLLRLEQSSSSIKIQSRKQAAQNDLNAQRALIKRLTERLQELDNLDDDNYSNESSEDLLAEYGDLPPTTSSPPTSTVDRRKDSSPESTLRNRHHSSSKYPPPSSTTTVPSDPPSSVAPLLESDSTTQAALTSSLLSLATALKQSSQAFSTSLEADTAVLNAATEGLDKNAGGMEAAGKRMGMLRRMTEGKGWFGRMMLYAWIAGLWVVAILLVFVGPKFRF